MDAPGDDIPIVHLPPELRPPPREDDADRHIRRHIEEDDRRQGPLKVHHEHHQRNRDIRQDRHKVEQQELKDPIDRRASIEDAEDLARLAPGVEGEREIEQVVEAELGHAPIRVLHHRRPEDIAQGGETARRLQVAEADVREDVEPGHASAVCKSLDEPGESVRQLVVDETADGEETKAAKLYNVLASSPNSNQTGLTANNCRDLLLLGHKNGMILARR
jgi:hypothetical protein